MQSITQLPNEVQMHIFSFLDGKSLVNTSEVCTQWHFLINECKESNTLLWKPLLEHCEQHVLQNPSFRITALCQSFFERCYQSIRRNPPTSFRERYIQKYRQITLEHEVYAIAQESLVSGIALPLICYTTPYLLWKVALHNECPFLPLLSLVYGEATLNHIIRRLCTPSRTHQSSVHIQSAYLSCAAGITTLALNILLNY